MHLCGAGQRLLCMTRAGLRCPEHRHDRVAHELVDSAAVGEHYLAHRRKEGIEHADQRAALVLAAHRGVAAQVGEQDAHLLFAEFPGTGHGDARVAVFHGAPARGAAG
jgi:hypothetical protein